MRIKGLFWILTALLLSVLAICKRQKDFMFF